MEGVLEKENSFWRGLWKNSKTSVALFLGSILFIGYSVIAINYEMGEGWRGHPSVQDVLTDISRFIPVGGAIIAALIGSIDLIIFFFGLYMDWKKKRLRKSIKVAVEEARAEGYAAGYEDGQRDKDS